MTSEGRPAPRERPEALAGLVALGAPESRWARLAGAAALLALAAAAGALVFASGSFAWGAARTLYGDVLPRLGALLALVVAIRILRRARPAPLLAAPDRAAVWRDRIAGLAEGGLVIAAVFSALEPLWRLVGRLAGS